jgi:hypothetical protein
VLADIITQIEGLLEGTVVPPRSIPVGKFEVVGSDYFWQQDCPLADPRPAYIDEDIAELTDDAAPSDVSGDYYWRSHRIMVHIGYGFDPDDDPTDRATTIADDELIICRCLRDPLTHATVANWAGADVTVKYVPVRDNDGVTAILYLTLTVEVSYREDLS